MLVGGWVTSCTSSFIRWRGAHLLQEILDAILVRWVHGRRGHSQPLHGLRQAPARASLPAIHAERGRPRLSVGLAAVRLPHASAAATAAAAAVVC